MEQPLETPSSSSNEENTAIKLQESFPKYVSGSAVVILEEMYLRTKLLEDPSMHKGGKQRKKAMSTMAKLLSSFIIFRLSFLDYFILCGSVVQLNST